jgi:hypothetical protein
VILLFSITSRPALEPTQPPFQCVLEAVSLGVKRPGLVADHSTPSSTEVKNDGDMPPFPNTSSRRGG